MVEDSSISPEEEDEMVPNPKVGKKVMPMVADVVAKEQSR